MNPKVREMLNEVGDFIRTAPPEEVMERGVALCSILEKGTPPSGRIRPRHAPEEIGRDFIRLGKDYDVWRYGITYGWLAERFEPPILWLPTDLPGQARVGVGVHAGTAATEEVALLDDAFFLYALVGQANDRMWAERRRTKEPGSASELATAHRTLTRLNMNVGTYARLTVLTAVAFVESLVNSVGTEASRSATGPTVLEQLQGMRKGRYLSLEFKLERYPALIRTDAQSPCALLTKRSVRSRSAGFLPKPKK
ncbi:hypothetical protein [Ramlibacter alkalitolerans]|uniref:Uncharacterized protein n=1 Tax=Ramlibacter alkalitolerans TaxID=2039631 RepID=A0ABS1JR16_9BURK|nr:hypothetical protein [Ramlibacter alkalitolerans]MBL0426714.1 hypothetical protein [Ramlibacter alkalitolerans]